LKKGRDHLKDDIYDWNLKFPFDHQWRHKYKIPYGSKAHREMCLFDIKFDISEEKLFKSLIQEKMSEKVNNNNKLLKRSKISKVSKKEVEDYFDNLDLDQFDNMKI